MTMKVGIVGGGQLGRMLALAAHPLGIRCVVLDPREDCCASDVAQVIVGEFDDAAALERLAARSEFLTFEFENVAVDPLRTLTGARIRPTPDALAASQDRLVEKNLIQSLGIETARFAAVDSIDDLRRATTEISLPAVLKTRRMGYDGKGQYVIREPADVDRAWTGLAGTPLILESFVPFQRELSIVAVRANDGTLATYPLAQTKHVSGILAESITPPATVARETADRAVEAVTAIAEQLDYVGVLALELFDCGDKLLANEFAPRVHNSGHWSIDGAVCSQFENHIRAVVGLPLGLTTCHRPTAMLNLIGGAPPLHELARFNGLHIHDYRKAERPGRKIGHVNLCADTHAALETTLQPIRSLINHYARH